MADVAAAVVDISNKAHSCGIGIGDDFVTPRIIRHSLESLIRKSLFFLIKLVCWFDARIQVIEVVIL